MRRFLRDLVALSRTKVDPWLDEARALRVVTTDVAQYAAGRLRDLRHGTRSADDPMETLLDKLLLELSYGLVEAKKKVAVSIADEKRLAHNVELERANVDEWLRRALEAAKQGDLALVAEARKRRAEHELFVATLTPLWEEQKASVEELKEALRALHVRIENAKRARNMILARRRVAQTREATRLELRRVNEIARLVHRLGALATPEEEADEETGDTGDRGPLN